MNLREHEDNRFTKETDKVEAYLLRIVQRYFDVENNYTQENVEAIILESLTRLKQILVAEKGFMFSLNKQTGHIAISIESLGGEPAFRKNTAFNKNFGDQEDTICEGNDSRLLDKRMPTEHTHDILEVKKLQDKLDGFILNTPHLHDNMQTINMLKYMGANTTIDLIVIEQLEAAIENYYNILKFHKEEATNIFENGMSVLATHKVVITEELENAKTIVKESINWLQDLYKYTDEKIATLKISSVDTLFKYMSKECAEKILNLLKEAFFIVQDGEIEITTGQLNCIPKAVFTLPDGTPDGHSVIEEKIDLHHTISPDVMAKIGDCKFKLYFRYDKDGKTITVPLPFAVDTHKEESMSSNTMVHIEASYSKDGEIYATCRYINKIPCYADNNNFYTPDTIIAESRSATHRYDIISNIVKQTNCELCLIDSPEKNEFVNRLLHPDRTYFIQGLNSQPEGTDFKDNDENVLTYFNWEAGQPVYGNITNVIYINGATKKWSVVDKYYVDHHGYVMEYKIKRFIDHYENPRIYYQLLGNKEGM